VPRNWEEHYAQESNLDFTPVPLLVEVAEMLPAGRALDLAAGAGRNTLYLASLGWSVVAVDASPKAIEVLSARSRPMSGRIETRAADLETGQFAIEPASYDLICDFFYLQRNLFPQIRQGVRPGGVFAAEIHLRDGGGHQFVLEPGELRNEFNGWKVLYYSESTRPGHTRATARIIARRA
jgi:SAM-dependent methyltransferase